MRGSFISPSTPADIASEGTTDEQWEFLKQMERDYRRSSITKLLMGIIVILLVLFAAWLASGWTDATHELDEVRNERGELADCRADAFAKWADELRATVVDGEDPSTIGSLEDRYNACK